MRYLFVLNELPFPAHRNGVALINYQILNRAPEGVVIDLLISDTADAVLESEMRVVAPCLNKVTYVGAASARRFRVGNLITGAIFGRSLFEVDAAVDYLKFHRADYDAVYIAPLMSFVDPGRTSNTFMNAVDSFARFNDNAYRGNGQLIDRLKSHLYILYEKKVLRRAVRTSFVSRVDADFVSARSSGLQVVSTPNGVDTDFFTPSVADRDPFSILFTGNFSYSPNSEAASFFARDIFPAIRERYPDACFYLVGPHAPQILKNIPGVIVTGFVDDIRDYYQRCSVFVCPLLGGAGIKNKILEAMSSEIPIVTTRLGMDGIDGTVADEHFYAAETSKEFADRVSEIWEEPEHAMAVAKAARLLVTNRMTWSTVVEKYFQHLSDVAADTKCVVDSV